MRRYIFKVKRTHNNGVQNSKYVEAPVIASTYQQAYSRLKKAKCRYITFIREECFEMWKLKLNELERLKYDTRQVRS